MRKFYTQIKQLVLFVSVVLFSTTAFAQTISIGSGATLTVGVGATIKADSIIISGASASTRGTLNIKSSVSGSGSLIVNGANAIGFTRVNVERYLPSSNWHIVSSPVGGLPLVSFAERPGNSILTKDGGATFALAPYNEASDGWDPYTTSSISANFQPGKGYVTRRTVADTVTFSGALIFAGDNIIVDIDSTGVSVDGPGYGWNAIGNPYTSSIRAKGGAGFLDLQANKDAISDEYEGLYVWDQSLDPPNGDYLIIADGAINFPGPGGVLELDQDTIAMGQGFIVRSVAGGSTVEFNSAMQVAASDAPFKSAETPEPAIRLTASTGEFTNSTIVAFAADKSLGLDPGYDVGKLKGNANIALYTQLADKSSNADFAIQTLPNKYYDELSIPLGLDIPNGGEMSFSLEYMNLPYYAEVYLEDTQLNSLTRLDKEDAVYTVSLASAEGYGRFNLLFQNFSETLTAINENIDMEERFKVFVNQKKIIVDGPADGDTQISVYGIDGRKWYQGQVQSNNRNVIDANGFATGIYLVRIEKSIETAVHKVILISE